MTGLIAGGLAGCDAGAVDGSDDRDQTDDPPDLICSGVLSVAGTRAGPAPDPVEGGCEPVGTWTVNVVLEDAGACGAIAFDDTYIYEVTGDPDLGYTISYTADPTNENNRLKITSNGGGCAGSFEHWSGDSTELVLLKPYEFEGEITGLAEFERYSQPQL